MNNPYEWLQSFIEQVPPLLQPLIVAIAGAIPYFEGEGAAAFGIIAGIHPVVAAIAAASGNALCVIAVVTLGSFVRGRVVRRRAAGAPTAGSRGLAAAPPVGAAVRSALPDATAHATAAPRVLERPVERAEDSDAKPTRGTKGRARLRGWLVRFGVPGASILAPLVLPTMLTAAFFVASGVSKQWVILWQVVAIVLWTSAVALAATGLLALIGG